MIIKQSSVQVVSESDPEPLINKVFGSPVMMVKHSKQFLLVVEEDQPNTLITFDSISGTQTTLNFDNQIKSFCIFPENSILCVLLWNEKHIHFFDSCSPLFKLDIQEFSPFEGSCPDEIDFITFSSSCFLTVSLTNGNILSFNFYPKTVSMIKQINSSSSQNLQIKDTLVKFSEMYRVGEYVVQISGNYVLNSSGDLYRMQEVKNRSNTGYRMKATKIKSLVKGKVVYLHTD